jgi:hypothetical protein
VQNKILLRFLKKIDLKVISIFLLFAAMGSSIAIRDVLGVLVVNVPDSLTPVSPIRAGSSESSN